jgi:hypothetical protein
MRWNLSASRSISRARRVRQASQHSTSPVALWLSWKRTPQSAQIRLPDLRARAAM